MSSSSREPELRKQIDATLTLTKGETIDVCYALMKIIETADNEEQPRLFAYTAEMFGATESSDEITVEPFITKNEQKVLEKQYGRLIDQMLDILLTQNLPESDFYRELWGKTLRNPFLDGEQARAFALYWVLVDKRLPYFRLPDDGAKMSNEDFRGARRRLRKQLSRIRFILASEFSQRTEKADLLLREIDAVQGKDRIILMVEIVDNDEPDKLSLLRELGQFID